MHPDLLFLIWVCGVIGAIIIFFLLAIAFIDIVDYYREKAYRNLYPHWEDIFLNFLSGDIPAGKIAYDDIFKNNYHLLWRFLLPYLESLRGEDYDKILELSRLTGMQDYYKKKLRRGTVFNRAFAARVLGKLQCHEAIPRIIPLLNSRHPAVIVSAAHSLADMGEASYMIKTARALLHNTSITYEGATEIMVRFGENNKEFIINYLEKEIAISPSTPDLVNIVSLINMIQNNKDNSAELFNQEEKLAENERMAITAMLVDVLGYHRTIEALDTLEKLLEIADEETTIHIFKAFLRIDMLPEELNIEPFFRHPNWVIRSLAARISVITGEKKILPHLNSLLNDDYWWVRYRAAEALWNMGKNGRNTLKRNAKSGNSHGASVSRYILAQEG